MNELNLSNEELLNEMKKEIKKKCSEVIFDFKKCYPENNNYVRNFYGTKVRKPNKNEIKQFMISLLKEYYMTNRDIISRSTYYTMKGHIKRWQINYVSNYLKRIGYYNDFISRVNTYKNINCILETNINIQLPEKIKTCTIDMEVK